eukprot:2742569-Rhodomonas_salina.3
MHRRHQSTHARGCSCALSSAAKAPRAVRAASGARADKAESSLRPPPAPSSQSLLRAAVTWLGPVTPPPSSHGIACPLPRVPLALGWDGHGRRRPETVTETGR